MKTLKVLNNSVILTRLFPTRWQNLLNAIVINKFRLRKHTDLINYHSTWLHCGIIIIIMVLLSRKPKSRVLYWQQIINITCVRLSYNYGFILYSPNQPRFLILVSCILRKLLRHAIFSVYFYVGLTNESRQVGLPYGQN